ncbi:hypothetical protein BJV82DRAFT_52973 [Fennellomyces sp. T-0311]|nr:hypothetical protein BJV82DRAFT_52973 [Fennellomyces sp. T-0311]
MLMSRPNIVNSIIHHLSHEAPKIRVAAVWCIINWTWINSDDDEDALVERINRLRALGVERKLQAMEKDPSRDVRDRVRTALDQLTSIDT